MKYLPITYWLIERFKRIEAQRKDWNDEVDAIAYYVDSVVDNSNLGTD